MLMRITTCPFSDLLYVGSDVYINLEDSIACRPDRLSIALYGADSMSSEVFCNWLNTASPVHFKSGMLYRTPSSFVISSFIGS